MTREQATIKLPSTEIPLIALDDWKFWALLAVGVLILIIWRRA